MPASEPLIKKDNRLLCSFCGKSQDEVAKLISGPGVYICDECVLLCINKLNAGGDGTDEAQPAKAKCSFCGKSQKQVGQLIFGPGNNICNECIELCTEILDEEFGGTWSTLLISKMLKKEEGSGSSRESVLRQIVEFVYSVSSWQQIFKHAMEQHGISVDEVMSEVGKKIANDKVAESD